MAKKKEFTAKERANYERQQFQQAKQQIEDALSQYKEHPEQIAELLVFKSRFYQYSMNNSLLIQRQNRGATYVGSFQKWKELGYSVKSGQHGLKVLVPVETTTFITTDQNGQEHIHQLRDATPEEKGAIKAGKIDTHKRRGYRIGNVFDIAQTTCPPEDYPKVFHQGYASEQHTALFDAVKAFSASQKIPVTEGDVQSISLRGYFDTEANSIKISDKLTDTEKLSTLTHELGHALMFKRNVSEADLPMNVRELEADSISVMLQSQFGLQLTQSRIDHLKQEYEACTFIKGFSFENMLKDVNSAYLEARKALEPFLQKIPEIKEQPQQANEKPAAAASIVADTDAPAPQASYTIYQIKGGSEYRDYRWQALDELSKAGLGVRQKNYDVVFSAPLAQDETLDSLYEKFNLDPPADFHGHSLSVSDVVVLEQNGQKTANYVDRFGFQETPEFFVEIPQESFAKQVEESLAGKMSVNDSLYVCETPDSLTTIGLKKLPVLMSQRHLKDIVHSKNSANPHWHGIDINQVKSMRKLLAEPAMVFKSLTKASDIIVVTSERDSNDFPIIVPIHPDGKGHYEVKQVDSNFVTSMYGKERFIETDENGNLSPTCLLGRVSRANGILFVDKEKSQQLVGEAKLRLLSASTSADFSSQPPAENGDSIFKPIIPNNGEKVNQNQKNRPTFPTPTESSPDAVKKFLRAQEISSAVINDCINRGLLYQDGKQAAVFSSSDGKCAIQQATVAGATGMKEIAAEDGAHGWYVDNGADKLYVAKTPVQVLEAMTASDRAGADISTFDYFAIGSASVESLAQIVQTHPHIKEVVLESGVTGQALQNACPDIRIRQKSQLSPKNKSTGQSVQEDTAPAV